METKTMKLDQRPSGVLLVGSIPLQSASDVFTDIPTALQGRLSSIPDGETGGRGNFIAWQIPIVPAAILHANIGGPATPAPDFPYTLADFRPTDYDEQALASYAVFKAQRAAGLVPAGVRFQVSLPTPLTVTRLLVQTAHCGAAEPLYEARLLEALQRVQAAIPAADLAVQWDAPVEVGMLEHAAGRLADEHFAPFFADVRRGVVARWRRLLAAVASDVPVGLHLCYGDMRHRHFVEPVDMRLMVDLANDVARELASVRPVAYVHMPVPKDREDEAFYAPLADLRMGDTKLYLGVVHAGDLEGTRRRIAAARAFFKEDFGVATECGLGRTPREELNSIMEISKEVSSPIKLS